MERERLRERERERGESYKMVLLAYKAECRIFFSFKEHH
jgi:hypothetical protein